MTGRAETPEAKRAIVERLLAAWVACPSLRLGQFIDNAGFRERTALFYVEYETLAKECERFAMLRRYADLRDQWHESTRFTSSVSDMEADPAMVAVVAMGGAVVPFLLDDLKHAASLFFPIALAAITGENPVKAEHVGRISHVCDDWLAWGLRRKP